MSYKSKFEASEHRAHYQNIATKILKEMSVLRSLVENSPIAPRRWIWELIQNAKDVHDQNGVRIKVDYNKTQNPFVSFKHDGKPFSADNIRFLIEQISSKDRTKDEEGKRKTTGKFGTGFLTTHLLSEIVKVEGVAKEPELDYRKFTLELDRSGFEISEITDSVQSAKEAIANLDETPSYSNYSKADFNTEFFYRLEDSISHKVALAGLKDLNTCLPYTLAFVKEIDTIEITSENRVFYNSDLEDCIGDNILLEKILIKSTKEDEQIKEFLIATITSGLTTIATPISKSEKGISLCEIDDTIPRLFCDFPLIGAERFHFPVIINNPNFNPTDPRDGVFLTTQIRSNPLTEENKSIISEAINLYFELLDFAVENNWGNLHLLAQIRPLFDVPDWIDNDWYKKDVLDPIRHKLLYAKIVENSNRDLAPILTKEGKKYIWFPSSSKKEIRSEIWKLANFWFPHCLPNQTNIELWFKLLWKECGKLDLHQFATFISQERTIEELSNKIKGKNTHEWLNDFYAILEMEEGEYDSIINKNEIFPNQNGVLCKKSNLYFDDGTIGDDFKDILKLLGNDIRNELLDENIEQEIEESRDIQFAVKEINSEVSEKATDREVAKSYSNAFKKLLVWFQENPEKAKSLFPNLYKNKHLLYDDDEILENISKAEQLDDLLKECNASSISELRELIEQGQNQPNKLLPVTQEILLSMGISSPEEWAEAIKDKNLAALFSHESIPTTDMFVYVQSLINQAKGNIIKRLETLENYDTSELDSTTAPTILAGIKKDGQDISIVARPAYEGEVIIYYGSERDILDYEPSELWIDDGIDPRKISLGHILKKAQIIKFPI